MYECERNTPLKVDTLRGAKAFVAYCAINF